jgi:CHAT domain-containing protein/Tfp pilus assembly protein PilF
LILVPGLVAGSAAAQDLPRVPQDSNGTAKESQAAAEAQRARWQAEAVKLNGEALQFFQQGKASDALKKMEQALVLWKKLYPPEQYPQGHPDLAQSLNGMGFLLRARGELSKALPYCEQALAMRRQLYPEARFPKGHPDLALSLNNVGAILLDMGTFDKALVYYEQALAMNQRLYPKADFPEGHAELARSLNNLGYLLEDMGEPGKALPYYRQGLAMRQKVYAEADFPQGHPELANSLTNLGGLMRTLGEFAQALPYLEQALVMRRKLYPEARFPRGHPDLAMSLNNVGAVLLEMGEFGKALPYYEQTLAMFKRLYPEDRFPQGHPELAQSLNNMGYLLQARGELARALPYCEQALAMKKRLYPEAQFPRGHPDLATSLNNLGLLWQAMGEFGKALPYCEQALAMRQWLYPEARFPQGHPDLATSLNNLGFVLEDLREYDRALLCFKQALAMRQQLYPVARFPQGHPQLAHTLHNLGFLLRIMGEPGKALSYAEQALVMYRLLGNRFAFGASEAEALSFLRSLPRTGDAYLSLSLQTHVPAATSYALMWASRAPLTRLLQRRHQATQIGLGGSAAMRQKWQDLVETRQHLGRLLLQPGKDQAARDRELARLTDRKETLERELAALLPEIGRARELDALGPTDLAALLPQGTAFIDLLRYTHVGKERQRTPRYVAFMVLPDRTIRAVDLHDADPIDQAVLAWRRAIEAFQDTPADAARVAKLLWQPLARELPRDTATLYLAPDGELARLPWAALPGQKPGTALLEDLAVAVVPHGPFLLEQLKYPTRYSAGTETVLALGAVDYGPAQASGYAPLAGTAAEVRQVTGLAGARANVTLEGDRATWTHLKEALPKARYAHLATHGFFNAKALLEENQRLQQQRKSWEFAVDRTTERVGFGVRSPLSYTGLVLAGANQAAEGAIVTGEALVELPLERLRLCVLSACQTGLGDLGPVGGEGVQGLQRAFHLAGCPNVVASLWNVNDQATAALMAKFYHGLWHENKTPLEALRQAQLTIYRHPERIARLADRAAPDFNDTIRLTPNGQAARAPTKLWAAFVLSGVGQ